MCFVWADEAVADVVWGTAGVFGTAFVVQSCDINKVDGWFNRVYPSTAS